MSTQSTQFKASSDYVWMLKNKVTGEIYPTYTYKNRKSARKAIQSRSGRFTSYTPVKVYKTNVNAKKPTKFVPPLVKGATSSKGFGFWLIGSRRRFK